MDDLGLAGNVENFVERQKDTELLLVLAAFKLTAKLNENAISLL
jgi:hypothetical protein